MFVHVEMRRSGQPRLRDVFVQRLNARTLRMGPRRPWARETSFLELRLLQPVPPTCRSPAQTPVPAAPVLSVGSGSRDRTLLWHSRVLLPRAVLCYDSGRCPSPRGQGGAGADEPQELGVRARLSPACCLPRSRLCSGARLSHPGKPGFSHGAAERSELHPLRRPDEGVTPPRSVSMHR